VKQGVFREDLFHRLNVIRLRLPALRERREDIPALTRLFLQKSAKDLGVEAKRITDAALTRVMNFEFPGNVRQLENICHWLTVMAPAQVVEPKDLPPELQAPSSAPVRSPFASTEPLAAVEPVPSAQSSVPALQSPATVLLDAAPAAASAWLGSLEREARDMLQAGVPDVWDFLTRKFEAQLIHTALDVTRGRRIEAAQKLGIGRNTITRKIQELGLE